MAELDTAFTDDTGTKERPADWTILIYLSADNNLSEECIYALKELREHLTQPGAATFKVNVVALIDPVGRGIKARLIEVGKSGPDGNIDCDTLPKGAFGNLIKGAGEVDMGDSWTLTRFLYKGIEKYQAEHYMVILSGHAAGTHEGFFLRDEERPLSLIPSSLPPQLLEKVFSNDSIKAALKGKKVDILGFDACMMSMIEVCYQLRDINILDLVVGSEGFSLNAGWPYDDIVSEIQGCKIDVPLRVAQVIVEKNFKFYRDYFIGGLSTDLSVIKLKYIGDLKAKVDTLAEKLIAGLEVEKKSQKEKKVDEGEKTPDYFYAEDGSHKLQDALILAHWAAQAYNGEQCVDLYDFCCLLSKRMVDHSGIPGAVEIKSACEAVVALIKPREGQNGSAKKKIVEHSCYTGAAFQYSYGISIYFPWSKVNMAPNYYNFDFGKPKSSAWSKFLKLYVKATQRRMRTKEDKIIRVDDTRSTPPYGKGPEGKTFSMRNPPSDFDHCVECGNVDPPKMCKDRAAGGGGQAVAARGEAINKRGVGARKLRAGKKLKSRK